MKDDFKDVLKELADKLPAEYEAHMCDNEFVIAYQKEPNMYAIVMPNESDIQNSRGILTLLQFVESQGQPWYLYNELRGGSESYIIKTYNEDEEILLHFGATKAEAVAKAALEVARRMK